jgi:nucleoside-diphosphate-sugar epimerase
MTVAEACKYYQINRLVFASTCSVYGQTAGTVVTEESSAKPISLYAETKLESENGILSLADDNFSPCVLRFATIYGLSPRMRFDLVVNLFAAQAAEDGKILIYGGDQWRPFLHVSDAARAIVTCLESKLDVIRGQIFNAGSDDENYRIKDLAAIIGKVIPDVDIQYSKNQVDERTYMVSFKKIGDTLGFSTQMNVERGVAEIAEAIKTGTIRNYSDTIYDNHKLVREIIAKEYEGNASAE